MYAIKRLIYLVLMAGLPVFFYVNYYLPHEKPVSKKVSKHEQVMKEIDKAIAAIDTSAKESERLAIATRLEVLKLRKANGESIEIAIKE
jgi:type II secretory pathway component PulM